MSQRTERQTERTPAATPTQVSGPMEDGVRINGLEQVIELLRFADPAFRESLLRRLTAKDPKLAQSLRRVLR